MTRPSHYFVYLLAFAEAAGQAPAPGLRSVPTSSAPIRIVIDQLTRTIELRSADGESKQSWDAATRATGKAPLVQVPARHPVDIVIVNANPLLYRYDVQATVVARRVLPTCATIGSRLASTSFFTNLATIATAAQPALAAGVGQLFQPPPPPSDPATRGDALVRSAALTEALSAHRAGVERYVHFLETVRALAPALDDSLAIIAELGETQPLDSLLRALTQSLERTRPGLSQAARVPATMREELAVAQPHLAALAPLALAVQRGNVDDGGTTSAAGSEIVRLTGSVKAAQDGAAASYRILQAQLLRIENAKARTTQVFSTDASDGDVRRVTIETQPSTEYQAVFRSRVGREEVYVEPTVSVLCQLSFGVAFMQHAPAYALNNGVVQNKESDQRAGVAAMLHVASAAMPLIGAVGGFGFGSDGAPDLYAGGSIRAFDPLMINLGVVWQRSHHLPSGVSVGQTAPDLALQDLSKRYTPGFFWGISIAR